MVEKFEPTEADQDNLTDYDSFEDWDPEEYLEENDEQELDFNTDESYRGEPDSEPQAN